jgi:hypothetical protein
MAVLWCGGEISSWQSAGNMATGNTGRAGYSRAWCASNVGFQFTTPIASPLTSGWFSFRGNGGWQGNLHDHGIGRSNVASGYGYYIGGGSVGNKVALYKYDGSWTRLVEESGTSYASSTFVKFDLQLINYGASGTINVYASGALVCTYSGNLSLAGVDGFDCFVNTNIATQVYMNELIIADQDTRLFSVVTHYPNGAGDTNDWTGAGYTAIDEYNADDGDVVYSDVPGQNFQAALSNLPAGNFVVKAVKVEARMSRSPTGVANARLGVKTNSAVDVGGDIPLDTAWTHKERLMVLNPVTGTTWTQAEIDALQLNVQAGT